MNLTLALAALFLAGMISAAPNKPATQPKEMEGDAYLSVSELIEKYGYPCETYQLTTPDGYILTVQRIPHGKIGTKTDPSKVIFLQHGLLSSSADWIMSGTNQGLAYVLADQGFDVWMGNARGNSQSRNHTVLSPDSNEFWQFSWHEIGFYDLPAMIDFVLEKTGQPDLYYVGHSQGTTSFFVMASQRPEYNAKIRAQFSLAPIVYMNHMTSPLMKIMAFWQGPIGLLLNLIGMNEFLPNNDFMAMLGDVLCKDGSITQLLCSNALFAICGFSPQEMNSTMLPILMGHTPAGSSTRQLLHYAQEISSGHFRQYDYGMLENINKYGSPTPPKYDLSKVTAPVYLFYSHNDWLSAENDVLKLYNQLPNVKGRFLVTESNFNHLDYMFGIHAKEFVYNKVISLLSRS